jgi:hypothetical protein
LILQQSSSDLSGADHKTLSGSLHQLLGDGFDFIDLHETLDLQAEPVDQSDVAAGNPNDGCDSLGVREICWIKRRTELPPLVLQYEIDFLAA